jgi:hypothetical protein
LPLGYEDAVIVWLNHADRLAALSVSPTDGLRDAFLRSIEQHKNAGHRLIFDDLRLAIVCPVDGSVILGLDYALATPVSPTDGLDAALTRLEARPTTEIETGNALALFEKAKRSATQEVTITAQALRMLLPAIENEAKTQVFRALRAARLEGEVTRESE